MSRFQSTKKKADLFAHVGALSTERKQFFLCKKKAKTDGDMKKIAATPPFYFGYTTKTAGTLLL